MLKHLAPLRSQPGADVAVDLEWQDVGDTRDVHLLQLGTRARLYVVDFHALATGSGTTKAGWMKVAHKKFSLLKLFQSTAIRKWFWDVRNDKLALETLGVTKHGQCFDLQLAAAAGGSMGLGDALRDAGLPPPDPSLQEAFKAAESPLVTQRDARGRLAPKWIRYAADDVRYLLPLKTAYKLDGLKTKTLRKYKKRWP